MTKRTRKDDPERMVPHLRGRHLVEPPASTVRRAFALSALLPAASPGFVSRVVALLFDSAAAPLPAGVRSGAAGERRRLYRLGEGEARLDVRVRREPGGALEVAGQVLPPEAAASAVVVAGRTRHREALGPAGDFLVRGLPARPKSLTLEIVPAAAGQPAGDGRDVPFVIDLLDA